MNLYISAKNLRLKLKEILERVSKGESFTIVYNSKPVAKLVPIDSEPYEFQPDRVEDSSSHYWDILDKIKGTSNATDITTPDNDKNILRKRLNEKYGS